MKIDFKPKSHFIETDRLRLMLEFLYVKHNNSL